MIYKRVLLKLSGEALMGDRNFGHDPQRLIQYAKTWGCPRPHKIAHISVLAIKNAL